MDSALARQFLRLKRSGVRPHTWLTNHLAMVGILVPATDLRKVVEAAGEWEAVATNIKNLMDSSLIGRTVFGFCAHLVNASQYKATLEKLLDDLKDAGISAESVDVYKKKAQTAADHFTAISAQVTWTQSCDNTCPCSSKSSGSLHDMLLHRNAVPTTQPKQQPRGLFVCFRFD